MVTVIVESPYAGDIERNVEYLEWCMLDCLRRGEAPYASHYLYTKILDDNKPEQRKLGIDAGLAWRRAADKRVFYIDLGWSSGMEAARALYERENIVWITRRLAHAYP